MRYVDIYYFSMRRDAGEPSAFIFTFYAFQLCRWRIRRFVEEPRAGHHRSIQFSFEARGLSQQNIDFMPDDIRLIFTPRMYASNYRFFRFSSLQFLYFIICRGCVGQRDE